ncbi:hypothetical protein B0H67DRAFT_598819 [Lasiosphaeris hirsuta]|uniref:Zn(2)-C6 fungal-type domain-containing protein n=1 Tax=Lasiosphaeris hirsuta TaxID=260670 RepID=A0AA40B159_9PEZI|nr:hypothetical protein B0H67DRAFT_598819 [Lasiosphaeris hirsuta]
MPGAHGGSPAEAPTEALKRKRDADDGHSDRIPQPPPPSGNGAPINYLTRANQAKLRLIQSDSEAFADVLSLMNDYEGVLSRHESLAANLGAKLTAPRLLRAMEILFEGAITVSPTLSPQSPFRDSRPSTWYTPSWLEIVSFAKSNPAEFNLTSTPDGRRVCRFLMKNVHVEISEDDWRLIMSGVLDRFPLASPHPLEEDETAELATLDILEQRVQTLIKKADEVARKARQLNYHLSGRKAAITSRRSTPHTQTTGFQAMNQPPARPSPSYDLHADLLQQFLTPAPSTAPILSQPNSSLPTPSEPPGSAHPPAPPPHSRKAHGPRQLRQGQQQPPRIEKLARGDAITPPCDRCRRLKTACIKHLTACQGCTRKHAKCSWKGITADEIAALHKDTAATAVPVAGPEAGEEEEEEVGEGARVLREISGRHRVPSSTTSSSAAKGGTGGAYDLARILFPDGDRDAPRRRDAERDEMEVGEAGGDGAKAKEPSSASSSSGYPYQQHSLLSHMASVATAAAEARERRGTTSRGSSVGRD